MKTNWQTKKLGEVCDFKRGLTYSKRDEVDFSSNVVLRANNVNLETNSLDFYDLKYIKDSIQVSKDKKVSKGSIIICTASGSKSHLGKVALINDDYDYAFGGFMGLITPKKEIESNYLFYNLISDKYKKFIDELSDGVNINNLKFDDLKVFEIPLPPLPEQQRIVAILDEAFAAIATAKENAEKNLQNSRELFESYLQSVFANPGDGWEEKKLGELCELIMGQSPDGSTYNTDGIGIPLINGPVEFGPGHFSKTIKSKFTTAPTKLCKEGDLILCVRGSTTGRTNVAGFDACIGRGVAAIRYTKYQAWINHYINSIRAKIYKLGTGSTFPNISSAILANLLVPFPPLPEQRSIVAKLDALSAETKKLEAIYRQKLADLDELKKSVLQKAFEGEL